MLKIRELHEVPVLFELMSHPEVFPYVRHKANTIDELYFITKQTIEKEEQGELISRTIMDEYFHPIGTINLFDIKRNYGFLATWIGKDYFGKGYNRKAKEEFFDELFFTKNIETIFMKIRKTNVRSAKAALKLPYVAIGNDVYQEIYQNINRNEDIYDLFMITKDHYLSYKHFVSPDSRAGIGNGAQGEEVS